MIKKKLIILCLIFLIPVLVKAEGKLLVWEPGPVDDEHGPAGGFRVYLSNDSNIDLEDPDSYYIMIDVEGNLQRIIIACNKKVYAAVTAYNSAGESGLSEVVSADFGLCVPRPPINVQFEPISP